jgi:hypothetical protein
MNVTTEALFMSPAGFGVESATPVQLAACRVRDGRPLRELAAHPDVVAAFGGAEAIAALPSERGVKPEEFFNVASARTAKTTLAVASALVDTQTVDLSGLGHGEIPRVTVLSLKLDVADVPFRRLVATVDASPVLRPLLLEKSASSLLVRHPSGRAVEVAVVAGGKAGGSLAARWSAGLIADEAPKMGARSDDTVTNLDDALSVVRERLLPGAQIQCIGSPWAPSGTVYDAVQTYFGKPTDSIVVMRTTGPAGNPKYWTPERLDRLREKDEVAWRINALGEFIDPESGLLSPVSIRANTREGPLELPPDPEGSYCAAVDPSEGGANGNAWTLVIVDRFEQRVEGGDEPRVLYRVAVAREWRGLRPEECWKEIAAVCARYDLTSAVTDQYAAAANADLARRFGLNLEVDKATAASRLEDFTNLATLLHQDAIELPPDRQFRRDLLAVKKRTTQTGMTIVLPKTSDGRHCDFAPALAAAVKHAVGGMSRADREDAKRRDAVRAYEAFVDPERAGVSRWHSLDPTGNRPGF